ncbi:MAG: stage V sporulation protein AD [Clostridia bacterium]|nr:stage V sporulation protein AD [Clostridia bacterium]
MMSRRIGRQTVMLKNAPGVTAWASVAGQKEHDGPYGALFDAVISDELNGESSFEAAERSILEKAIKLCALKANRKLDEVQMLLAGDLLNQIISAGFAARNLAIPFYGLYGACSTMSESLSLGSMIADGGFADRMICATCSHFCTAERQYRAPLELGNQRTPTAQWTVTGAGAVMVSSGAAARQDRIALTHTTCGRVIDLGITDQNNMGAAMAPAAADTLTAHFDDTGRGFDDFDLVVTGDLGILGRELLIRLLDEKGIRVKEERLFDCGSEIFAKRQDTHCGGSGCGCAASMLCAHILPQLYTGRLKRVLFMATGALLSPTTTMQGESIPGVAHAVVFEHREEIPG